MPIANCIIEPGLSQAGGNIVERWAQAAGVGAEEMTVNLIEVAEQQGKRYGVMATLYLPSAWPEDKRVALQLGLATALAEAFSLPPKQVQVTTQIVASGQVVEQGRIQTW